MYRIPVGTELMLLVNCFLVMSLIEAKQNNVYIIHTIRRNDR